MSHGAREHDVRILVKAAVHASPSAIEWPTWGLVAAIYGTWAAFTMEWSRLPGWLVPLAGGWLVAWHGSLQHETIHGHPSRSRRLNALLGGVPLGLWLPYGVYRETHLRHHAAPLLADPVEDPESAYVTPEAWARAGLLRRASLRLQTTLVGTMLVGPLLLVASGVGRGGAPAVERRLGTPAPLVVARDRRGRSVRLAPRLPRAGRRHYLLGAVCTPASH